MDKVIKILFENKDLYAVDKPAGVLAYPLPVAKKGTVPQRDTDSQKGLSLLREKTIGDMVGGIPVHRLDRDTSGVMLLAKTEEAKKELQKLFAERKIEKTYTALVWGKVEPEKGEIKIPLGRGSKDRLRVVPASGGRESHTIYQVEKYFPRSNMSLLKVDLKTGRTHQIRVHFAAIGHPVVGDKTYSNNKTELGRQFLHASKIEFIDPFSKKEVVFKSDLPEDLRNFLKNTE